MSDDIKTIDQLSARDLGRRVHIVMHNGDVAEGSLGSVTQYGKGGARFAIFNRPSMFEIQVGQFHLSGINSKREVRFL